MSPVLPMLVASIQLLAIAQTSRADVLSVGAGLLDRPVIIEDQGRSPGHGNSVTPGNGVASPPGLSLQVLRSEVAREQAALERLPRNRLQARANRGERAAQVALAADFAREAAQLGFAPMAANDALSDAVRWYSLAASRGIPGAPSLDQAGIRFYPIRAARTPLP